MYRFWVVTLCVVAFCLPASPQAASNQSASGHADRSETSEYPNQIVTQEVVISAATLDSSQLEEITSNLTARRWNENDQEVRDRIRDAFQQRGYFDAEVTSLKIKALDPLARPKPVRIEAEIAEGVRFRVGAISFVNNRAMSAEQLRKSFPVRAGDLFDTGKIRSGIQSLRDQYIANGYLEAFPVPSTEKSGEGQLTLRFEITEGPQYRMGDMQLAGNPELADELQLRWKLKPGEPFDASYPHKFLEENSGSLPKDFSPTNDISVIRDCRDLTVAVRIELDPKRAWQPRPKDIDCDKEKDPPKTAK